MPECCSVDTAFAWGAGSMKALTVALIVAVVCPCEMVTDAGDTDSVLLSELVRFTVVPPNGAGLDSVIFAWVGLVATNVEIRVPLIVRGAPVLEESPFAATKTE